MGRDNTILAIYPAEKWLLQIDNGGVDWFYELADWADMENARLATFLRAKDRARPADGRELLRTVI